MKKQLLTVLVLCAMPTVAMGQESESRTFRKTDMGPKGTWTASVEYQRIFDRDLDDAGITGTETDDLGVFVDTIDVGTAGRNVELESNSVMLRLAYTIYAPEDSSIGIEVYALLGGADVELSGDVTSPGDPTESFHVDGDFAVAFGGGARVRLYQKDKLTVFADSSVRYSDHDADIRQVNNLDLDLGVGDTAVQDFELSMLVWQASLYVSYEMEMAEMTIIPYGGIRLSLVDIDVDGHQDFFDPAFDKRQTINYDASEDDILGLLVGVEASITNKVSAFVELHVIDETALSAGVTINF